MPHDSAASAQSQALFVAFFSLCLPLFFLPVLERSQNRRLVVPIPPELPYA